MTTYNTAKRFKANIKEETGKLTGNRKMQLEGEMEKKAAQISDQAHDAAEQLESKASEKKRDLEQKMGRAQNEESIDE